MIYLCLTTNWRQCIAIGFLFGFAFYCTLIYWVGIFGTLPLFLLAMIESVFIVTFAVSTNILARGETLWIRLILVTATWVVLEWVNSLGKASFPWGNIGYSQYTETTLIQISRFTGIWGVSLLLILANTALANLVIALRERRSLRPEWRQLAVVTILVLAVRLYGINHQRHSPTQASTTVAIVQGNIDQSVPHDAEYMAQVWKTYSHLSRRAAHQDAQLIVWPEGVVPGIIGRDPALKNRLISLAQSLRSPILTGGYDEDFSGNTYNCAFLISPAGKVQRYAKVHLVPFGEFVPLRDYVPLLDRYRVTPYDTSPGSGFHVLQAGKFRVGTAICFESIFPQIPRRLTLQGANLLVTITNDAWFLRTSAAQQHLTTSVFRAVENNRYMLHASTTGISAIIDPEGHIVTQTKLFEEKNLLAKVELIDNPTLYTFCGDWIPYLCVSVIALASLSRCAKVAQRRHFPKNFKKSSGSSIDAPRL